MCKGIIVNLFLSFPFLLLLNIRMETNNHSNLELVGFFIYFVFSFKNKTKKK